MGEMFRQYWLPALLAEELPEDDCPPVRVKLLSERMVAFRDSDGRYGLIDEFCAHRGASLWFGRNEGSGLRCPYHGWKYDITGQAVEVPSEPENSTFCAHVKLTSYPLVKVGDVLWTYMGDPEKRPPLPEFEFAMVPPEQTYSSKRWQECNWLQAFEGGIDSSHVSFLHSGGLKSDPLFKGTKGNEYNMATQLRSGKGRRRVVRGGGVTPGTDTTGASPCGCGPMVPPRGDHPSTVILDPDRRRELLGLLLRLPPRAPADRPRGTGDEGRPRRAQREHPRHVPAKGQ
jgi:nitrite reductase/ring-hydroxylating ferredoxin subunit